MVETTVETVNEITSTEDTTTVATTKAPPTITGEMRVVSWYITCLKISFFVVEQLQHQHLHYWLCVRG